MIMCVFFINNCRDVWKKKLIAKEKFVSLKSRIKLFDQVTIMYVYLFQKKRLFSF